MNLETEYTKEKVSELLEKFKGFKDKTVFKFGHIIKNYKEHAEFCTKYKVNIGYEQIDNLINGIQPGEVVYIVSPTDVGKTAMAMNIIQKNLNKDTIIPFFSLENNEYQMFERMIQLELGSFFYETQKKFIENDTEFISRCEKLTEKWSSCINVVHRISLDDIIPYCRTIEALTEKRIKFIVIDYVQLIKHLNPNEYTRISDIAQTIKEVSLTMKLPIIVLSQTSRMNAKDGLDLYSAKGSGEIENSAQIYFTLEVLKELPIRGDYSSDLSLKDLITQNLENKSDYRPLILKPHKLKRSKKEDVILLFNKKTLRITEYSKSDKIF